MKKMILLLITAFALTTGLAQEKKSESPAVVKKDTLSVVVPAPAVLYKEIPVKRNLPDKALWLKFRQQESKKLQDSMKLYERMPMARIARDTIVFYKKRFQVKHSK